MTLFNEANGIFAQGRFSYVKKSFAISATAELVRRGYRPRTNSDILVAAQSVN